MLRKWAAETPTAFRFALKSPRRITHEKKLADVGDDVARLYQAGAALGDKLGPVLFQLPPFLQARISSDSTIFWRHCPPACAPPSSSATSRGSPDDVYDVLRARDAALCIAESEDLATPLEATAPWGYLRLRRQDYGDATLAAWAERVRAQSWERRLRLLQARGRGQGAEAGRPADRR